MFEKFKLPKKEPTKEPAADPSIEKYKDREDAIEKNELSFPWTEESDITQEDIKKFFTPKVIAEHVLYCPKINRDPLDQYGIYGNEPGFIFVEGINYRGVNCFNDRDFLEGNFTIEVGAGMLFMPHSDFLPNAKLKYVTITPTKFGKIFDFLKTKLDNRKLLEIKLK